MSDTLSEITDQFKELSDLELEILFIDGIYKKIKRFNKHNKRNVRSEFLLVLYLYIIETLKKFKLIAKEGNRSVPHEETVDMIINKSEAFLSRVANDDSQIMYVSNSLSTASSFIKEFLWQLRKELVETPKYSHLNNLR